jgi:virginiamycin B lyase
MGNLDVVIAEYSAGEPGSGPYGLTAGPDDAVWFTQVRRGRIGRMSVSSPRSASSPSTEPTTPPTVNRAA